jgi:hypothetical protein
LDTIKYDRATIARNIKVVSRNTGCKFGNLLLYPCAKIDQPKVLMAHLTLQYDNSGAVGTKYDVAGAASQHERWDGVRPAVARDGPKGEGRSNIGTRIY